MRTYTFSCYHTYVPKLTLNIDETVVKQAKQYAHQRDTSVSRLVEDFLAVISKPAGKAAAVDDTPVLHSLQGLLRKADRKVYREHLVKKYR